ncbi:MAG: M23 family metallopeptidase [Alcaligenaceae bacterium]|nr:M23 family metallopeptidase [Alcaligenaceae bacterium]
MFKNTMLLKTLGAFSLVLASSLAWAQGELIKDVDSDLGPLPQLDNDVAFKGSCRTSVCGAEAEYRHDINFDSILKKPVASGRISSHYGWRLHPIAKTQRMHTGIDYAVPIGTAVKAAQHGKVVFAGYQGGYGKLLVIKHNSTYRTVYAHLDKFKAQIGDWVNQGDIVAYTGNTGLSTGPHLHYEIRKNGLSLNPLTGESSSEHILVLNSSSAPKMTNGRVNRQSNGRVRTILK